MVKCGLVSLVTPCLSLSVQLLDATFDFNHLYKQGCTLPFHLCEKRLT